MRDADLHEYCNVRGAVMKIAAAVLTCLVLSADVSNVSAQAACGEGTACEIPGGSYYLALPESWDGNRIARSIGNGPVIAYAQSQKTHKTRYG